MALLLFQIQKSHEEPALSLYLSVNLYPKAGLGGFKRTFLWEEEEFQNKALTYGLGISRILDWYFLQS